MDEVPDDDFCDNFEDIEVIYSDDEEDGDHIAAVPDNIADEEIVDKEVVDLAALTFIKHNNAVYCSDVSQDGNLAVTGGGDDTAYLWNANTGEVIMECTGHKDSVTEVCFSHDGQYVATGDMAGMIQVWCTRELKLVWCFEGDDMEWLFWHPLANVLLSGCTSGIIYVWQIPQDNCKVLAAVSDSSASCAKILPNGKQLLAGYEDGQVRLWDIKEAQTIWSSNLSNPITNIDISKDGSLAIISPSSAVIKLSDGKVLSTFMADGENEIETALFNNELGVVVTGSLSGHLCVWDLGKRALKHQAKIDGAVTILKWGPSDHIFIGATDGGVYVCDVKNYNLLESLTGHIADILSISVFKQGNKILTTSDDGSAKIFNIKSN